MKGKAMLQEKPADRKAPHDGALLASPADLEEVIGEVTFVGALVPASKPEVKPVEVRFRDLIERIARSSISTSLPGNNFPVGIPPIRS